MHTFNWWFDPQVNFLGQKKTEAGFLEALGIAFGLEAKGFPKQGRPVRPAALGILRLPRPYCTWFFPTECTGLKRLICIYILTFLWLGQRYFFTLSDLFEKFKCNIKNFYSIVPVSRAVDLSVWELVGTEKVQEERVIRKYKGRVGVDQGDSFYLWGLRFKFRRPHSSSLVWKVIT